MAYFKFVEAIAQNRPIDVYNHGQMRRDFTYIDDVIEGITRVMKKPQPKLTASTASTVSTAEAAEAARAQSADTTAPYKIYNIGNHSPVTLMDFITTIEQAMGKTAQKNMLPMQPGDVPATYADVQALMDDVGFKPSTPLKVGIQKFVDWYQSYYA